MSLSLVVPKLLVLSLGNDRMHLEELPDGSVAVTLISFSSFQYGESITVIVPATEREAVVKFFQKEDGHDDV